MLWRFTAVALTVVASAQAQSGPVITRPYAELTAAADNASPGVRWFRLQLPSMTGPLWLRWQIGDAPTYDLMRWPTYDWQALLLNQGPVSITAFNRVAPAIELDCTSTTCAPMLERTVGLDLHLNLGGRGVVPENYVFMLHESVFGGQRNYRRTKVGIGGLLDF